MLTPADKAPPKGALEEAVSLVDDAIGLADAAIDLVTTPPDREYQEDHSREMNLKLADLRRRRAALQPRLAKRCHPTFKLTEASVAEIRRRFPTDAPPPEQTEPRGGKGAK